MLEWDQECTAGDAHYCGSHDSYLYEHTFTHILCVGDRKTYKVHAMGFACSAICSSICILSKCMNRDIRTVKKRLTNI